MGTCIVDLLDPSEGDAAGWLRSKGQGSISSVGASQCLFAGKNVVTPERVENKYPLIKC